MKLLHVDASILGDQSASRRLSDAIVKRLTGLNSRTGISPEGRNASMAAASAEIESLVASH